MATDEGLNGQRPILVITDEAATAFVDQPYYTDVPVDAKRRVTPEAVAGKCNNCQNHYDRLYLRGKSKKTLCIHCCELEAGTGKVTGRGAGHRGTSTLRPLNQPAVVNMFSGSKRCRWCGTDASPSYSFYGYTFNACGWAHAGHYMDWLMDELLPSVADRELEEGEAYVRRSLGVE